MPRLQQIIHQRHNNNNSKHQRVPIHRRGRYYRRRRKERENPENTQKAQSNNINYRSPATKGPATGGQVRACVTSEKKGGD